MCGWSGLLLWPIRQPVIQRSLLREQSASWAGNPPVTLSQGACRGGKYSSLNWPLGQKLTQEVSSYDVGLKRSVQQEPVITEHLNMSLSCLLLCSSCKAQRTPPEAGSEDAKLCQSHVQTHEVRTEYAFDESRGCCMSNTICCVLSQWRPYVLLCVGVHELFMEY